MTTIRPLALAACIAVAGLAAPALAQPLTDAFTYQGRLIDAGSPADGGYDFEFRLFNAATGGTQLGGTITRTNQAVENGVFTQTLNFGDQFEADRVFIEIRTRPNGAANYTTLPRQGLATTPFASQAREATVASFALDAAISLDDAYDNGRSINADAGSVEIVGELDLGRAATTNGRLELFGTLGAFPFFEFFQDASDGGRLNLNDEAGAFLASFEADGAGEGAFMQLIGGDSGFGGLVWDGNAFPNNGGRLSITGPNSSLSFDTNDTGDDAVVLPNASINSAELSNEPGLATRDDNLSGALLTSTVTSLYSRSITAPADGFIVAICTVEVFIDHVNGSQSNVELGLATAAGVFQDGLEYTFEYAADNPSDGVVGRIPTIHATFPVSAGTTTIHLNGRYTGGGTGTDTSDIELTLIYIPTAYGATSRPAARPNPGNLDDQVFANQPGFIATAADIAAERAQSVAANEARILEELAAMRARMAELEAQLRKGNDGPAALDK